MTHASASNLQDSPVDGAFGRVPASIKALLPRLTPSERGVYLALCLHVNSLDWLVWPSVDRLAESTGHDRRTVQRALRSLEQYGAIQLHTKGGGRNRSSAYIVTRKGGGTTALSTGETAAPAPPLRGVKQRHGAPETAVDEPPEQRRTERQKQQQSPPASDSEAFAAADQEVLDALTGAGVGEPKRAELAGKLAATMPAAQAVALVKREASKAANGGKGTGAMVLNLEAAIEQHTQAALSKKTDKARKAAQAAQDQAALDAELAGLTDEEWRAEKTAALRSLSGLERSRYADADPRTTPSLRSLIAARRRAYGPARTAAPEPPQMPNPLSSNEFPEKTGPSSSVERMVGRTKRPNTADHERPPQSAAPSCAVLAEV